MGSLFDKLQENAKKAKKENEESQKEVGDLLKVCGELEEKIKDLKKDQTEH